VLVDLLCTGEFQEDISSLVCSYWDMTSGKFLELINQAFGDMVIFLQEWLFGLEFTSYLPCD